MIPLQKCHPIQNSFVTTSQANILNICLVTCYTALFCYTCPSQTQSPRQKHTTIQAAQGCHVPLVIHVTDWTSVGTVVFHVTLFIYEIDTSPLQVKDRKIQACARHLWPLSRKGSLSCQTFCSTGPRFLWSVRRTDLIQSSKGY